ncbi:hypothetical protein JNJ66_01310 [Candidatus Saccharibacteria bacterium]|nr:hypothetical protein [Candidatus Saccharibacteria bacterium]
MTESQEQTGTWYFIRSVKRRVCITPVPDNEWEYDVTRKSAKQAEPGDIVLWDQTSFDKVLAGLHLIVLDVGRRFVTNAILRATFVEWALPSITKDGTDRMRRIDAPKA